MGEEVVYAADCTACELCGEPVCPHCDIHYADCGCAGPDNETFINERLIRS